MAAGVPSLLLFGVIGCAAHGVGGMWVVRWPPMALACAAGCRCDVHGGA